MYCNKKKKLSDLFPIIYNIICLVFVFLFTLFVVENKKYLECSSLLVVCLVRTCYPACESCIFPLSLFLVISRTFLIDLIPELCVY